MDVDDRRLTVLADGEPFAMDCRFRLSGRYPGAFPAVRERDVFRYDWDGRGMPGPLAFRAALSHKTGEAAAQKSARKRISSRDTVLFHRFPL